MARCSSRRRLLPTAFGLGRLIATYTDLKFRRDEWGRPADPTPAEYSWEYSCVTL
jgi:hypothetical protein